MNPQRGTYWQITDPALVEEGHKAIDRAVEHGLLQPAVANLRDHGAREKYVGYAHSALYYDLYDKEETDPPVYLFQQRLTHYHQFGSDPRKTYLLLSFPDGEATVTWLDRKRNPSYVRACQAAAECGDAVRFARGEVTMSQLQKKSGHKFIPKTRLKLMETLAKWQAESLCPLSQDGANLLVWKHVRKLSPDGDLEGWVLTIAHTAVASGQFPGQTTVFYLGNQGFPYQVNVPFTVMDKGVSMATAGPMGALRDWKGGDQEREPLVMAFWVPLRHTTIRDKDGVFCFTQGRPVALYRAEHLTRDGCNLVLLEGEDVLPLITPQEED